MTNKDIYVVHDKLRIDVILMLFFVIPVTIL